MSNKLEIIKGDRIDFICTVTQNGTAFPLTDYSAKFYIKKHIIDKTFILEKVGVIDNPATGIIDFSLTPTQTKDLTAQEYCYEIKIYKTDYVYTVSSAGAKVKIVSVLQNEPS